jgi:uncharacterized protein (DUF1499 family)
MLAITLGCLLFIIAAVIVITTLFRQGRSNVTSNGWIALTLGVLALVNAGSQFSGGGPPIHDISTDTINPPVFIAVAELRSESDNPAEYLDDGTAKLQADAYPDITTITLNMDQSAAFTAALSTAQSMGWEIVAAEESEGRIEATASTPYVGFKDDVVIRVQASENNSLVDVRSKSRVGKGDVGVNAARIRKYSAKLRAESP